MLLNQDLLLNQVYPIGSIYMSVNSTNPGTLFGGTWKAWGAGRVPVGVNTSETEFNTVEKTGGSKAMQKHSHTTSVFGIGGSPYFLQNTSVTNCYVYMNTSNLTSSTAGTGDSGNLQPYITCYMWKRTA